MSHPLEPTAAGPPPCPIPASSWSPGAPRPEGEVASRPESTRRRRFATRAIGLRVPDEPEAQRRLLLLCAAAMGPAAAHRLAEYLALIIAGPPWNHVFLHVFPPLAMVLASWQLWHLVPSLPGHRAVLPAGHRGVAIAAGMLLGLLAAGANLLAALAGNVAGTSSASLRLDPGVVALVVHVVLLAPVAEEVGFRGILYRQLRQAMVPGTAAVASSLVFAMMHGTPQQVAWAFALGVLGALAYEATRSLVTPMLVHGLFNAVPIGVAVARARPRDLGPMWLVAGVAALVFALAARSAGHAVQQDQEARAE